MKFSLREIATVLGVTVESESLVTGWSVDSRTIEAGDLFFALRGPNHDGAEYVEAAFARGAVGAVVDKRTGLEAYSTLRVPSTQQALEDIAAWARSKWGGDVVGVTGGAGKTSTKDVIAT